MHSRSSYDYDKAWSDQSEGQARRRHPLCALARWEGLTRFLDDGHIKLDNSPVERKNALFAGSDDGAEHRAVIASVIETCKLNDGDPLA